MHRFKNFEEAKSLINFWIDAKISYLAYLEKLPDGFREAYEFSDPIDHNNVLICDLSNLLFGDYIMEVVEWYVDKHKDTNTYEYKINWDIIEEVEIQNREQLLNFIQREFFNDKE